jgi:hypothetical protein
MSKDYCGEVGEDEDGRLKRRLLRSKLGIDK